MANGTRPVVLVLTLIVGIAVGWLIHGQAPTPPPPPPPPPPAATPTPPPVPALVAGHHLIEVGPAAANVSEDWAAISKAKGHRVIWFPQDDTMTLQIIFRAKDFPTGANGQPPFKGGKLNTDQVIPCKNGLCTSPKISDDLPEGYEKLTYKSTQILISPNGKKDEADAGIIIEK